MRAQRTGAGLSGATKWLDASEAADFAAQTTLTGLRPDTSYSYVVETRATRNGRVDGELTGGFRTLPVSARPAAVSIAMLSCQMYCHMDRPDGFHLYESIQRDAPHFLLSCGQNAYDDNEDPIANSEAVARYHWQRMYSLPTLVNSLRHVGGYWQKDDHDVFSNDAWPAMADKRMAPFTFVQGQRIFREQVPAPLTGQPLYRTVRAGADIELWLPEARDYRTPKQPSRWAGKTIWGVEQKAWLMKSLRASTATWKILVNPNPSGAGPDDEERQPRQLGFAHESRQDPPSF